MLYDRAVDGLSEICMLICDSACLVSNGVEDILHSLEIKLME